MVDMVDDGPPKGMTILEVEEIFRASLEARSIEVARLRSGEMTEGKALSIMRQDVSMLMRVVINLTKALADKEREKQIVIAQGISH